MRSTLDKLISWTGFLLAIVLLVAGGLLLWANSFVGGQVHDQLSMQNITMPTADAYGSLPQADQDALAPFAGHPMTKGPQAKAYANHYILVHMNEAAKSTYEALGIDSTAYAYADIPSRAACAEDATSDKCTQLTALRNTIFQGDTLRGLLLYGYAFATIGTVAGYAAIGALLAGAVMLLLAALGFMHARRVASSA